MAEGRGKRYSIGKTIEVIFADKDSNDESFDCGYDLDIILVSENEGDRNSCLNEEEKVKVMDMLYKY